MRQVVSLIKDDQVHYAVVDDDAGEMIPFASIMLPDPDRFGLHEAAVLGTNLITAIGLNGRWSKTGAAKQRALPAATPLVIHETEGPGDMRKPQPKPKADGLPAAAVTRQLIAEAIHATPGMKASEVADAIGAITESARKAVQNRLKHMREGNPAELGLRWEMNPDEGAHGVVRWFPTDSPPPPQGLIRSEASRRAMDHLDPQLTMKGTPRTRALPDPAKRVKRFIPASAVVAIINDHPEGITCRQIAERIWRSWGNDGVVERWVTRSVENRVNNVPINGVQWSVSYRQEGSHRRKYLHPL
jgi:hypothetical protein